MVEDEVRQVHTHLGTVVAELPRRKGVYRFVSALDQVGLQEVVAVHAADGFAFPSCQAMANMGHFVDVILARILVHTGPRSFEGLAGNRDTTRKYREPFSK